MALDLDYQQLFDSATTVTEKAHVTSLQDYRNHLKDLAAHQAKQQTAMDKTAEFQNKVAVVASPEEQAQEAYLKCVSLGLNARMQVVAEGTAIGNFVLDQIARDSLYLAKKLYAVVKPNLDLIKQGQAPA